MLIEVASSVDRSGVKRAAENILKYKDLETEIWCMWNVKAKVILVIIGETGTISKSLRQCLSNIPEKNDFKEFIKTTIFGTAHIFRKGLMQKYKTCLTCEMTLHVAQIVNTEQLQRCIS
jgi:hypothetical protein